jgi:molybdate transport system substrate-binding protein
MRRYSIWHDGSQWKMLVALLAVALASCSRSSAPPVASHTLRVFAAASLTQPFTDLANQFQASHPGVNVVLNFAGSNDLVTQIEQGAGCDIFASANQTQMDALQKAGGVDSSSITLFATNQLAIIVPKKNPADITELADLAKPGVKLIVADPTVPVGSYLLTLLQSASALPDYGPDFSAKVLANVKSKEENVKAVVVKIQLGEGDAGIAYTSDLVGNNDLAGVPIPGNINPIANYPMAIAAHAAEPDLAKDFEALVMSPAGQNVLALHGFLPPPSK